MTGNLPREGHDSACSVVISKMWLCLATSILGHEDGLAMLYHFGSSLFFLCKGMIFYCLGAKIDVSADPSGTVLGADRDCVRRHIFGEVVLELDRVSLIVLQGGCVKLYT
jgi:hypothetical protein